MKKLSMLFVAAISAMALAGCKKEDSNGPWFDLPYSRQFDIPAGIGAFAVHHFYLQNIPSRYVSALMQQGKTDADVTSILTTQATLTGVFGDADFGIVDQVSLRIYHESDPTDYVEIAYRQPVPLDPGNTLPLIPSLADSKRLASADYFSLDLAVWLRGTTTDNTSVQLDLLLKATY